MLASLLATALGRSRPLLWRSLARDWRAEILLRKRPTPFGDSLVKGLRRIVKMRIWTPTNSF